VYVNELQMPAVDGILSTRMIRFSEQESKDRQNSDAGDPQYSEHRVPIIALSASLYEESRLDYIQNGYVFPLLF
jgi:CheY-like chemotaxis protein